MTKNSEVIIYTGRPLMLPPEDPSEDIIVTSLEDKYSEGVITLQACFKNDEESLVEIELTKDMIKKLYEQYCGK